MERIYETISSNSRLVLFVLAGKDAEEVVDVWGLSFKHVSCVEGNNVCVMRMCNIEVPFNRFVEFCEKEYLERISLCLFEDIESLVRYFLEIEVGDDLMVLDMDSFVVHCQDTLSIVRRVYSILSIINEVLSAVESLRVVIFLRAGYEKDVDRHRLMGPLKSRLPVYDYVDGVHVFSLVK